MNKEQKEILKKQRNERGPYAIYEVPGGHGKSIMATAVIEAFKKQHPEYKVIVVTAHDGPLYFNPNVERVYNFGQLPYFYEDFIFDDTKIFRIDPYHTEDHILQRKHLIKTWCDLYNIKYNGEEPKIYINPRETELVIDKIRPYDGKPIMLLQTNGGVASQQYSKKSWSRDMPIQIAQKLATYYSKNYRVMHIRTDDQIPLEDTEQLTLPHRELYAVFQFSKKRLFIDSFAQHAAKAMGLDSVVCWIANKPEIFGYENNINIRPNAKIINEMNKVSYLEKYDITGQPVQQFPYDTVNLFDINEIVEAVKKLN